MITRYVINRHLSLITFPNLNVADVTQKIVLTLHRAFVPIYGIKTPDAIQIATALLGGATALVTNDDQLKRITEIEIVLLDELSK